MRPLHTVAETSGFLADAKAERMPTAIRLALKNELAADPEAGDLIVGSGGVRKLRLAGRGKGKSGGYRVLAAYVGPEAPVYLLAVLNKGDRETFTDAEVANFAKLTASIKASWRARRVPPARR
ncbi:type II toxin-antitoxin system RelE/ParE family toxin [Methylobacterium sp. E-066]|uniref:type II toxin-antitoxin system RelE/ParE family toxin n=1 Tax=Methylobacterium sp. E-066 TaxID=2836584 RepID=UPI001FB9135E|nr:type II toxin-antitoxin system RelE/ParE family toxin [Methylobacterium sp. E-066]MCJ2140145.1 type II toxin-antitoxin system RelE/ParE family toxin [Methylobacterium sp. E-066]